MARVRVNSKYKYVPVLMDKIDAPYGVKAGLLKEDDIVQVVNLPGCPKANTMGHCHINKDGQFAGLVCCNSLVKVKE